jgi:uncharacterized lipoprotein YmbA
MLHPRADPTQFYALTIPGTRSNLTLGGEVKRWNVALKAVEVPAYLRTKAMVVRAGTNEIHFADFNRWAEPLDQGIGRVVKEALSGARHVEKVELNSHGNDRLDYEITIRVLACEGIRVDLKTSSVWFAAKWEIRSFRTNSPVVKRGEFHADPAAWNGNDYGALAERLSQAIADMTKAMAADLTIEPLVPAKTIMENHRP